MPAEQKNCQNCTHAFRVEPEDFDFYARIKVPAPTFCPDCRTQRRMAWRNERALHHGTCAATGKNIITMFAPEGELVVYDHDYWWSDKWDQLDTGREYDFSKPFFLQFRELLQRAPLPNLANTNVVRSDYGNHNADCKDCYLICASFASENVAYSNGAVETRDSLDIYKAFKTERSYEDILCDHVNHVAFAYDTGPAFNSEFLRSCTNVNDCLGCVNLKSKSYCIFNNQYGKEEYHAERAKYDLGSYKELQAFKARFGEFVKKFPVRHAGLLRCVDVTGDMLGDAKNCHYCFDGYGNTENCKYGIHIMDLKDSYDGYGIGANGELLYEAVDAGIDGSRYIAAVYTHGCREVQYSYCCHSSANLFGCIGLRKKEYCILNRQYSKGEYETLVPKIIEHMQNMPYVDARGRRYGYGEFFPQEISPFAYNETIAQEYFPLAPNEAEERGFTWRTPEKREYKTTMNALELPDHIRDVPESVVSEVIGCAHGGSCEHQCTTAFRIIPEELRFYKNNVFPLPRLCPNCRHYERIAERNPFKLWRRTCDCAGAVSANGVFANTARHFHGTAACPHQFETPYSPERPETVYCEQCYQAEVA